MIIYSHIKITDETGRTPDPVSSVSVQYCYLFYLFMYTSCRESHETSKTVGEIVDEWQSADGSKFVSFVSVS